VTTCPLLEYLDKWNTIHQYFLKEPIVPVNGEVTLSTTPGIGMALDEDKILDRRELF
jgi:L-alanine-DL-glutamate epimerase-like enolase superfamily enzyme